NKLSIRRNLMNVSKVVTLLLTFSLLFAISPISEAQEWYHGGPWANRIHEIVFSPFDTSIVFGAQYDDGYWLSFDGGLTWDTHVTDLLDDQDVAVREFFFHPTAVDTMFVLVDYRNSRVLRTFNGGENWTELEICGENAVVGCFSVSNDTPFVMFAAENSVVDTTRIYKSTDLGETWMVADLIPEMRRYSKIIINPIDNDHILASGFIGMGGTAFLSGSTDGGDTWTELLDYNVEEGYGFYRLLGWDYENPDHIFAAGKDMHESHFFCESFDNGHSWQTLDDFPQGRVSTFYMDRDWSIYINHYGQFYKSQDMGENWNRIAPDLITASRDWEVPLLSSIIAVNPQNTSDIIIRNPRNLFVSNDGGEILQTGGEGLGYSEIVKILPSTSDSTILFAANDFGGLWCYDVDSEVCNNINHLSFSDIEYIGTGSDTIIISGEGIWQSNDGGETFNQILPNGQNGFCINYFEIEVDQSDAQIMHYIADYNFYTYGYFRSENGGLDWNQVYVDLGDFVKPVALTLDDENPNDLYIGGNGLFFSDDAGLSWSNINEDLVPISIELQPYSDGMFILSGQRQIYYSEDNGENITLISEDLPDTTYWDLTLGPTGNEHLFVATSDGVYSTQNYGETWEELEGPFDPNIRTIEFSADGTDIYLGTFDDGIWSAFDIFEPNKIDNKRSLMPPYITLEPCYPNPFNSSTLISFTIGQKSFISIEIYNIEGRKLLTIEKGEYSPGYYNISWNGLNYSGDRISSGTYFVKLSSSEGSFTNKILLMK
ncbi:T9SS type A sorting domain-containing protein, partial [Calditrichota bacterium]